MVKLAIEGLEASVGGKPILRGINLEVSSGEVHAVMGPNGAGKSTLSNVIMGRPGYVATAGSVSLDGTDILSLPTWERAQLGLFLAMQYPTEVPGVSIRDTLSLALAGRGISSQTVLERLSDEALAIGLNPELLDRSLNVDLSGGEKKRNETAQLAVLQPSIAILDELDSGLDIDALKACAERIEALTKNQLGVLCITHYHRLLEYLPADRVHILVDGKIVESAGPELAVELEAEGYSRFLPDKQEASDGVSVTIGGLSLLKPSLADEDPFADQMA
jgi:Fe-S cluster assembly ATP-binding protein